MACGCVGIGGNCSDWILQRLVDFVVFGGLIQFFCQMYELLVLIC